MPRLRCIMEFCPPGTRISPSDFWFRPADVAPVYATPGFVYLFQDGARHRFQVFNNDGRGSEIIKRIRKAM